MSYAKRVGGRFTAASASEAYQRQLIAPVKKWRKAWVAPTGLAPESSYKIYRWVRADKLEGLDIDNEDDNDNEDEEMEDGGDEENGDEADEDEAEDGEADLPPPTATTTVTALPPSAPPAAAKVPAETNEDTKPELSVPPPVPTVTVQDLEPTPLDSTSTSAAAPLAAESAPVATEIPSNAIEVSNIAPSAEVGHGDLGAGGGVEITRPEPSASPSLGAASAPLAPETAAGAVEEPAVSIATAPEAESAGVEEKMEVDEPSVPMSETPIVPVDEGLVMGEMHAPQPAMEVVGSDAGPKETE